MDRITISDTFVTQLGGIAQPIELCDADGNTLGHFIPTTASGKSDDCPYSVDELNRMRSEKGGRSLSEIWDSLEAKSHSRLY